MRVAPVMPRSCVAVGEPGKEPRPPRGGGEEGGGGQLQGLPPPHDVEMQDPPRDEGAVGVVVGALEVPVMEVVRTMEVPAIEAERTRADPTEGVRPPPAEEEAEEDETVGSHMVECAKLTHEWVEVSLLPRSVFEADLFLQALSCNA